MLLVAASLAPATAQVATDGTLGPKVNLSGNDIQVGADLGQIRGQNLFHSFERFGVQANGKVTFTGPGGLSNVISRVTGGQASSIDGTLASKVPGADVYLVNPSGVVFGPNARLDVPGSFHASTADELRFKDGAVFSALDPSGSQLSVAAPQAFGFLGRTSARIDVNGSTLQIRSGKTLSLTAGDVGITGATLQGRGKSSIVLAAQRSAGVVPVSADAPAVARDGSILIGNDARNRQSNLDISGAGGGQVQVESGALLIDGAKIGVSNTGGMDDQAGIDVAADKLAVQGHATPIGPSGTLVTSSSAVGRAGPVRLDASDISIVGGSIFSAPAGPGGSGPVTITADRLTMTGGLIGTNLLQPGPGTSAATTIETSDYLELCDQATILDASIGDEPAGGISIRSGGSIWLQTGSRIAAETHGIGRGGDITVDAPSLVLDQGRITATSSGAGDAGSITIAADQIALVNGGQITSSTFASSKGGPVAVAAGTLLITASPSARTGIFANAEEGSTGDAGSITVAAENVELRDGGQISSSTFGAGDGGSLEVDGQRILITGATFINAADPEQLRSGIFAKAERHSMGAAGSVIVRAEGSLEIRNSGQLGSSTSAAGDAGTVEVEAQQILIGEAELNTGIVSEARAFSTGNAGTTLVRAGTLNNGGLISSTTFGEGNAGTVIVEASSLHSFSFGVVASATFASGNAGRVEVEANEIVLAGSGGITTTTLSSGRGGEVVVEAGSLEMRDGSLISSAARSLGNAGTVRVQAEQMLVTGTASITTLSLAGARGDAGTVVLNADQLEIRSDGSINSATLSSGDGGTIRVKADSLLVDSALIISGSLAGGRAGSVIVEADELTVRGDGQISSFGASSGPAGDVRVTVDKLEANNAVLATAGLGAEGGRISVFANDLIYLLDTAVTSSGIEPAAGASLITLQAPTIALNHSTVTSLTGSGQPLQGSGEARILGDITVISADSIVAASSSVETTGLQTDLGSDLQLATGTFLDADQLLRESCAAQGTARSTFIRTGKGGLPPSPDRPLASTSSEPTPLAAEMPGISVLGGATDLLPCGEPMAKPEP